MSGSWVERVIRMPGLEALSGSRMGSNVAVVGPSSVNKREEVLRSIDLIG